MAEEIQEAIQIIRVAYDGVEICMKAGSSGLKALPADRAALQISA